MSYVKSFGDWLNESQLKTVEFTPEDVADLLINPIEDEISAYFGDEYADQGEEDPSWFGLDHDSVPGGNDMGYGQWWEDMKDAWKKEGKGDKDWDELPSHISNLGVYARIFAAPDTERKLGGAPVLSDYFDIYSKDIDSAEFTEEAKRFIKELRKLDWRLKDGQIKLANGKSVKEALKDPKFKEYLG
jgi:hypothetical protein